MIIGGEEETCMLNQQVEKNGKKCDIVHFELNVAVIQLKLRGDQPPCPLSFKSEISEVVLIPNCAFQNHI